LTFKKLTRTEAGHDLWDLDEQEDFFVLDDMFCSNIYSVHKLIVSLPFAVSRAESVT
jgi:hypothetical protein